MGEEPPPPPAQRNLPLAAAQASGGDSACVSVGMKAAGVVFLWSLTLSAAHRRTREHVAAADAVNTRGCSNLTLVLDNWKYAIMTQVRDLLLHDHGTVLPDYSRIQPLSDALGNLYKDFNGLKEQLSQFTARFDRVERFVDGVRYGRSPPLLRGRPGGAEPAAGRPPGKRTRVVVRRVKKPEAEK